jgi:adenosylhomocysteine nucleosidase
LISFGLAGGLAPGIAPGALLVPTAVIEGPRLYPCDDALMEFLGGSTGRPIAAGHKIAASVHDKSTLFRRTKAVAIDLESGAVARVASARRLPFAVLRAIADPAGRNLAPAALIPLKAGGGIDLARILASVAAHPGQIPGLIGLARDAAKARAALVARVKQLG